MARTMTKEEMLALAEHPRGRAFLEELVYGAARRDRERREGELEEVRQGRADAEHRAFELGAKNARLREALQTILNVVGDKGAQSHLDDYEVRVEVEIVAREALDG